MNETWIILIIVCLAAFFFFTRNASKNETVASKLTQERSENLFAIKLRENFRASFPEHYTDMSPAAANEIIKQYLVEREELLAQADMHEKSPSEYTKPAATVITQALSLAPLVSKVFYTEVAQDSAKCERFYELIVASEKETGTVLVGKPVD